MRGFVRKLDNSDPERRKAGVLRLSLRSLAALLSVVLSLCAFANSASANNQAEALFREGLVCYGEINFACAKNKLESALTLEGAGANRERLIEIQRYLAYSLVALGETGGARQSFERILALDPAFRIDATTVSPKISGLFAEVRRSWLLAQSRESKPPEVLVAAKPEPKPQEAASPPSEPQKPVTPPIVAPAPKHLAGMDFAASFPLQKRDREAFHPGFALGPHLLWPLGFGLFGGLALDFRLLPKRESPSHLYELGLFARFAYRAEAGSFRFLLPLSLGPALFGRGNPAKNVGLAAGLAPAFLWRLAPNWEAGPRVGFQSTLDPTNRHASSTFELGLGVHGLF